MGNPFLVIMAIVVAAVTAAFGIPQITGAIADANDGAVANDLANIRAVQSERMATTGDYATSLDDLKAGGTVDFQKSAQVEFLDLTGDGDSWCAVGLSRTGTYFTIDHASTEPKSIGSLDEACVEPARFVVQCEETVDYRLPLANANGTVSWSGGGLNLDAAPDELVTLDAGVTYIAEFTGTATSMNSLYFSAAQAACLREVTSWPDGLVYLSNAFYNNINLERLPVTLPETVTDLMSTFYGSAFNGDISGWDTSRVTTMRAMFQRAQHFNQDLSGWDTSNVMFMNNMFRDARSFNSDISGWDTSNVMLMGYMFYNARAFSHDLSSWDVSSVTSGASFTHGNNRLLTPDKLPVFP